MKDFRDIKSLYCRSDNATYYSGAAVRMANKEVCDKLGIKLESLDFNEAQKGKDQCNRDGAVAKRCIQSFVNSGNDVLNAKDVKLALDRSIGALSNSKSSVVTINHANGSIGKAKIKDISRYHFFKVEEESNSFREWEFYNIGTGKLIPLQEVGFDADVTTMRAFQKEFPHNKAFMDTKKKKGKENQMFCTDPNCIATFSTERELDNHLNGQKHDYLIEQEDVSSSAGKVKVMFAQKLKAERLESLPQSSTSTSVLQGGQSQNVFTANTEVKNHKFEDGNHMDWALRKCRKVAQFSDKQVEFLVEVFNEGERTNRKMGPLTVADMMRTAKNEDGQKRFSTSEYLRREQIASYFSRLAASRRGTGNSVDFEIDTTDAPTTEEDICDLEQCLKEMQADEETMLLQESLMPIVDQMTDQDSATENRTSEPRDNVHGKLEVRDGIEVEEIKVYRDGHCMFRSIAVYLDQSLQKCKQRDLDWPQLLQLATKETLKTDKLHRETISKMIENEKSYKWKNEE